MQNCAFLSVILNMNHWWWFWNICDSVVDRYNLSVFKLNESVLTSKLPWKDDNAPFTKALLYPWLINNVKDTVGVFLYLKLCDSDNFSICFPAVNA